MRNVLMRRASAEARCRSSMVELDMTSPENDATARGRRRDGRIEYPDSDRFRVVFSMYNYHLIKQHINTITTI